MTDAGEVLDGLGAGPVPWKTWPQVWEQVAGERVQGRFWRVFLACLARPLNRLQSALLAFLVKRNDVILSSTLPAVGRIEAKRDHAAHLGPALDDALIDQAGNSPAEIGLWEPDFFGHSCLRHDNEILVFDMTQEDEQNPAGLIAQVSPGQLDKCFLLTHGHPSIDKSVAPLRCHIGNKAVFNFTREGIDLNKPLLHLTPEQWLSPMTTMLSPMITIDKTFPYEN